MPTTILSSSTAVAMAHANPINPPSSPPTTHTNTASNVDVAEVDDHHIDNEEPSSSVGADAASVHSHGSGHSDENGHACSEADEDGNQTNVDDDTHTQYYEENGSYAHGSIPTTHFGASLPELTDFGHGHGFGHSGSPPSHMHIHSVFMGTTAPSAPQHAGSLADVVLCGSDLPAAPPTPASSGHVPSGSETSRSISAASGASKTLTTTPAAPPRSASEEARALETRQSQRRAKIGVRFKTKNCHTFQESGECRYGESCVFAHGAEELAKYVAIAEAAELAAAGGDGDKASPHLVSSKKASRSDAAHPSTTPASKGKTLTSSLVISTTTPATTTTTPTTTTTTNKYRDALMKSVPVPAPSSATKPNAAFAAPLTIVTTSTTPPRSPITGLPFNSKLTALQLHHHMTQHIPVASEQKRCSDYGFGANVKDERQRASEGNRRVPQEELERYRLERKAEAIARARMSDAGSSAPASPAPEGHSSNDFYMRQTSGGFNHYERSVSSQTSMSEHLYDSAAAALVSDSALASPVLGGGERRFPGMAAGVPTSSQLDIVLQTSGMGYGTRSNASSTSNGNYYTNPNADAALQGSGSWDYIHRQQPAPRSPCAASDSPSASARYSHNPYHVGR